MEDIDDKARADHGRYYCRRCIRDGKIVAAFEYSDRYGIYIGMLCNDCADKDGRIDFGSPGHEFDPGFAGERLDPDDP